MIQECIIYIARQNLVQHSTYREISQRQIGATSNVSVMMLGIFYLPLVITTCLRDYWGGGGVRQQSVHNIFT